MTQNTAVSKIKQYLRSGDRSYLEIARLFYSARENGFFSDSHEAIHTNAHMLEFPEWLVKNSINISERKAYYLLSVGKILTALNISDKQAVNCGMSKFQVIAMLDIKTQAHAMRILIESDHNLEETRRIVSKLRANKGTTQVAYSLPIQKAVKVRSIISTYAAKNECTFAEALFRIVTGA